jgi:cell division protein FtsB
MKHMKPLIVVLLALFIVLQYHFWFAKDGVFQVFHLKQQLAEQQAKNDLLSKRNTQLETEIGSLKKGGGAIENRARSDLGMVKKGETFYQLVR